MWEIIFLSRRQRQEWTQWRWMQDTTVGAWVVMLHEQFMGWVPSNISYVNAWYVHAHLGMYQDMHVCTCISWYVYMYVLFHQIMSRWSGFQMLAMLSLSVEIVFGI